MTSILERVPVVPFPSGPSWRERLEEAIARPGFSALAVLEGADPASLDEFDRVLHLQAWAACRNWLDAQLQAAVVAVAGASPTAMLTATERGSKDLGIEEVRLALRESEGYAGMRVATSRALATDFPATRALLEAGVIGWGHVNAVVDECMHCTPEQVAAVEAGALGRAGEQTPRALRMCVRRAVLRVRPKDAAAEYIENAARAGVSRFEDSPGLAGLAVRTDPASAEILFTAWDVRARVLRAAARAAGTDDGASLPVWRVRAAVDLAEAYLMDPTSPRAHGRPVTAVVVTELDALLGLSARAAELRGHGPIPAAVAAELARAAGSWTAVVTDGTGVPVAVARYAPSQGLRDWIGAVWGGCAAPGCTRPRHVTQDDHNVPCDAGGPTAEDNLLPYCQAHHQWKTERRCHIEAAGPTETDVRRWGVTPTGHRYPINHPMLLPDDGHDDGDSEVGGYIPNPSRLAPADPKPSADGQNIADEEPPF